MLEGARICTYLSQRKISQDIKMLSDVFNITFNGKDGIRTQFS